MIQDIAPNAELREIVGFIVDLDGRIPANTGSWGFIAWDPAGSSITVSVDNVGTASITQRDEAAPGPGVEVPLAASWVDSIQAFAATDGKRDQKAGFAQLVTLNFTSYPAAPGKTVWAMAFDAGPYQLVTVDGTYIGSE